MIVEEEMARRLRDTCVTLNVMELSMTETVLPLGVGLGLSAAAGLRVFLPMLFLGLATRLGWIHVGSDFQWVSSGLALGSFGAATVLEIAAYYIPWLDNVLDAAAGPCAVAAGIIAMAAVGADLPPPIRWSAAIIAGGGTAGAVQGLTTVARLKSTMLTGGLGNPVIATIEWIGALITSILAIAVPILVIVAFGAAVFAAGRIRRMLRPAATKESL
jgi:hypothetical protein